MRAFSIPIIYGYVRGLKLTFRRESCLTFLSFRNLSSPCPSLLEDECLIQEYSSTENLSPCFERVSAETGRQTGCSVSLNKSSDLVGRKVSNLRNWGRRKENIIQRITTILLYQRGDVGLSNQQRIFRDDSDETRILNDALALYLLRWFDHSKESNLGIRSVCRMINISALCNIKHISMHFLRYLASHKCGEEVSYIAVFDVLGETCKDRRILETVYSMFVFSYIGEQKTEVALELVCRMKLLTFFPSVRVVSTLIRMLSESKRMDLAWELFLEMQSCGMCFDAVTISSFIREYCLEGSLACACNLLFEMKNYGCKPDVVAYTIVIDALCKRRFLKEATSLLYKAIQTGLSFDSVSVTSVIDGYCKAGRTVEAMNLWKICGCSPNIFVYNSFMSELCTNGNVIEAVELFDEMTMLGMLPDCFSYTTIINGYCKVQNIHRALKYFGEMLKKGLRPIVATYTVLIDGYCRVGDLQGAEYLFLLMIKEGLIPDVVTYNVLINGHTKNDHMDKALKWLDMMRMDDVSPDIATYNILIHGLIKRGFVKESLELLDELIRLGLSPDKFTFTNVIDGFIRVGRLQEAYRVWCRMSENGMRPDAVTCTALLNGFCKAARVQEAEALFQMMLDTGLRPDIILYNTLVNGFCSQGNLNDACRLVNMMEENGIIPNNVTYWALVHGYEKHGFANASENAAIKIHQLLRKNGIAVDKSQYVDLFDLGDEGSALSKNPKVQEVAWWVVVHSACWTRANSLFTVQCAGCVGLFFEVSSWYPKDWSCIREAIAPEELLEEDKLCRVQEAEEGSKWLFCLFTILCYLSRQCRRSGSPSQLLKSGRFHEPIAGTKLHIAWSLMT
ncbi:hypothetical protein AAC387_Pa01g1680 [Persea americana]